MRSSWFRSGSVLLPLVLVVAVVHASVVPHTIEELTSKIEVQDNKHFQTLAVNACATSNGGCGLNACVNISSTTSVCSRGDCTLWGDPHFIPLGRGSSFDFQGSGDFTLVQLLNDDHSTAEGAAVHGHFRPCGGGVTCTYGIAAQEGGVTYEVMQNTTGRVYLRTNRNPYTSVINPGDYGCFTAAPLYNCPSCKVCHTLDPGGVHVFTITMMTFTVRFVNLYSMPNAYIKLDRQHYKRVEGLCGLWEECVVGQPCAATSLKYSKEPTVAANYGASAVWPFGYSWGYASTGFTLFGPQPAHCTLTCPAGTGINAPGGYACGQWWDRVCATCLPGYENDGSSVICKETDIPEPPQPPEPPVDCDNIPLCRDARHACSCVENTDPVQFDNCILDVMATGTLEAARAYCLGPPNDCIAQGGTPEECYENTIGNCTNLCSFHGVCEADNTCNCTSNYSGEDCSVFTPPPEPCLDDCHGPSHGTCVDPDGANQGNPPYCVCVYGYVGANCSQTVNACTSSNGGCSPYALCTAQFPASRQCVCMPGTVGNGVTCVPFTGSGTDCGVWLSSGECQVGFLNPPQCCTRISNQTPPPDANATVADGTLVLTVSADALPLNYVYVLGLATSTTSFFSCQATNLQVVTLPSGFLQLTAGFALAELSQCLQTIHTTNALEYRGLVVLSLQFEPWGGAAHVGLYFWQLSVRIGNATQAISLLTVTAEYEGDGVEVDLAPRAALSRCATIDCTQHEEAYYARVGDEIFYRLSVDPGVRTVSASTHITAVLLEDVAHQAVALVLPSQLTVVPAYDALNKTLAFTVPAGTTAVRYLRVDLQIDFVLQSGGAALPARADPAALSLARAASVTLALPDPRTAQARSRFEVLPRDSGAASSTGPGQGQPEANSASDARSALMATLSMVLASVLAVWM